MSRISSSLACACLAWATATVGVSCTSSSSGTPPGDGGTGGTVGSGGNVGSGGTNVTGSGGTGTGGNNASGGAGGVVMPGPDAGDASGPSDGDAGRDTSGDMGMPPSTLGPAGFTCPGGNYPSPLPANLNATMIKGGFTELEGPVWVASQKALFFAQMGGTPATGKINKYTPADGMITVFANNVGVGGLAVDTQGMLVAASYDSKTLTRFDPATGTRTNIAGSTGFNGKPFSEVNDVVVRADGNIYFSDPNFGAGSGAFYRLSPPPESKVSLIMNANLSNGIAISPDGAWLYLSTTGGPALRRMALAADGSVTGAGTAWNETSSDGMAVDCAGNIYLSVAGGTNQIRVISPTDQVLGNIGGLGGGYVTNSAFGDDDRKTLYITTSVAVYKIQLNVPGFPN
ncbi:MAG: gluconolactonase [Myxococcales bacterium]|jgi:gluconolactonase|nr:gluconolactonase [Myxococcales bacterium]